MRLLRIVLIVILVAVTVLYGVTAVSQNMNTHHEAPTIEGGTDVLEISVQDDESALLAGLTARDTQDGDLTADLLVSGISKFTDTETATANAACLVFDSDGNMASLTRTFRYTDYTPPRFSLTQPLNYKASETISLLDRLHATDCIDGDLTGSIRVSYPRATATGEIYLITVQVTNSMGDTSELELEMIRQADNFNRPEVKLSAYLLYLEQGSSFAPMDYVSYVDIGGTAVSKSLVTATGSVDTSRPGTYFVHYSYNDGTSTGMSILTVVVE